MLPLDPGSRSVHLPVRLPAFDVQDGSSQQRFSQAARPEQEIRAELDAIGMALAEAYRSHGAESRRNSRAPTQAELPASSLHVRSTRNGTYATVAFRDAQSGRTLTWSFRGTPAEIDTISANAIKYEALQNALHAVEKAEAGRKGAGSPSADRPGGKRPKWAGQAVKARLDTMPKEIIEATLNQVPNGERWVTSLARTSRPLYYVALEKTRAKGKASDLIDRARHIRNIKAGPHLDFSQACQARLDEFRSIVSSAKDPGIPLRGKDFTDVLITAAAQINSLLIHATLGFDLMLETLEGLGSTWNRVSTTEPDIRREELHQLDQSKLEIFHFLSGLPLPGQFDDVQKGDRFDRLCSVLESIDSPGVKNQAVARMSLATWYQWYPAIGAARARRLVKFAEDNRDELTDASKVQAIHDLMEMLTYHDEPADRVDDYSSLCKIAASIDDDKYKAEAAKRLLEGRDWLPTGEARMLADRLLGDTVNTIEDEATRARAAAVEPIPQTP